MVVSSCKREGFFGGGNGAELLLVGLLHWSRERNRDRIQEREREI